MVCYEGVSHDGISPQEPLLDELEGDEIVHLKEAEIKMFAANMFHNGKNHIMGLTEEANNEKYVLAYRCCIYIYLFIMCSYV
jgi:hypothetical protein